jgi:putative hemin transport protein
MTAPTAHIRQSFARARQDNKARHRDIADKLQISEGELIAYHAGAAADDVGTIMHATRLVPRWPQIIEALEPLGEVMALTRNRSCVHEKTGVYKEASHNGHVGLVPGGAIDLRVFYHVWAHGFAVSEKTADAVQRSLQFFDAQGTAVHKVFVRPQSDLDAYAALVARFRDGDQASGIAVLPAAAPDAEKPDAEIDVAGLRDGWASLRDTHAFFGLLRRFGVTRTQALRLAAADFVQEVEPASCACLLDEAARAGASIMVFTGNPGMIQIHSGPVKKFVAMGPWLNVLDPGFNLHLREDHIARAWIVRKPTVDGIVTSVECFDARGETIAMFFGERKPGKPELHEWRALVDRLQEEFETCAA